MLLPMSPGRTALGCLRRVDLNHRPLGYEPKRASLNCCEYKGLTDARTPNTPQKHWVLLASC